MHRITLPRPEWIISHRRIHKILHATVCKLPFVQESRGQSFNIAVPVYVYDSSSGAGITGVDVTMSDPATGSTDTVSTVAGGSAYISIIVKGANEVVSITATDPSGTYKPYANTGLIVNNGQTVSIPLIKAHPGTYYDPRAQAIADLVMRGGYDAEVHMLHDINEPGCINYEDGAPCDKVYFTTSDNIPTAWALADYGYPNESNAIQAKCRALGALDYTSGIFEHRYEVYLGYPIIRGYPSSGKHGTIEDGAYAKILAEDPTVPGANMKRFWAGGGSSGTNSLGRYNIDFDGSTGQGHGTPQKGVPVDTEAPQAINCWLRGDFPLGTDLAVDLVNRWQSTNVTWQLGQIMLVARVYGLDSGTAWNGMENKLWSSRTPEGYLPNSIGGTGHDPESQDAGLAPYSATIINNLISLKGHYSVSSPP